MDTKPLSTRICLLLILLFGIAAYSNTLNVPFHFDDHLWIVKNPALPPPLNLGEIWKSCPTRFVANLSFSLQYVFTGISSSGFHCINLLIHLLAAMAVFGIVRLLFRTPALKDTPAAAHSNLLALASALIFVAHPVQTQAVTYIVQRMASLATLFYLAALWMYLKARLEDARHYRLVFLFVLAAMLTKEMSFTLPFVILLTDFYFFPVSAEETVSRKLRRWIPFAACLLIIPLVILFSKVLTQNLLATDVHISRGDYLLTEFRVLRTYLRLLVLPINQCLDYDYHLSSGWGDLDTWLAFSLLLSLFGLAILLFKKHRLLSFGIVWFFLTLSVESSFFPILDVIFEHRLYLPMFGFALFFASLLWRVTRSTARFFAILLVVAIALSVMTYARNEIWKDPITLWQDTTKKSPHKGRPYEQLGEAYSETLQDKKTALWYYQKALETGYSTIPLLSNITAAHARLGNTEEAAYYQKQAFLAIQSEPPQKKSILYLNQALMLKESGEIHEAIRILKAAIEMDPQFYAFHINLGEIYRETGQESDAIDSFRKAIEVAPLRKEGYEYLALLYKEKGEEQKALAVLVEYLKLKKQGPLLGD